MYGVEAVVGLPDVTESHNWTCEELSSLDKVITLPYINPQRVQAQAAVLRFEHKETAKDTKPKTAPGEPNIHIRPFTQRIISAST